MQARALATLPLCRVSQHHHSCRRRDDKPPCNARSNASYGLIVEPLFTWWWVRASSCVRNVISLLNGISCTTWPVTSETSWFSLYNIYIYWSYMARYWPSSVVYLFFFFYLFLTWPLSHELANWTVLSHQLWSHSTHTAAPLSCCVIPQAVLAQATANIIRLHSV